MKKKLRAKIHSFETFGTVDGPGIRFVIFFAGCPLRCIYCHNIDVVLAKHSHSYSVKDVMKKILRQKEYLLASNGGVTASGGDPVLHADFIAALFKELRKEGIHTALDTSLMTTKKVINSLIPVTDLFLISIKQLDNSSHQKLTGCPNTAILENIRYISSKTDKIWFRYLLLPGYTDRKKDIHALISFLKPLRFQQLELLPYHTLGVKKWKKLKIPYMLKGVASPSEKKIIQIKKQIEKNGIPVKV